MNKAPTFNDMLKLYSKTDLWEQIQNKNKIIAELRTENAALRERMEKVELKGGKKDD